MGILPLKMGAHHSHGEPFDKVIAGDDRFFRGDCGAWALLGPADRKLLYGTVHRS